MSYKFILLPLTLSRGDRRTSGEDSCKQVTMTGDTGRGGREGAGRALLSKLGANYSQFLPE